MEVIKKHENADRSIDSAFKKVVRTGKKPYLIYSELSILTGLHPETMKNYCSGKGGDGYVKDVIINSLNKTAQ